MTFRQSAYMIALTPLLVLWTGTMAFAATKSMALQAWDELEISGGFSVQIEASNHQKDLLILDGELDALERVKVKQDGKQLHIRFESSLWRSTKNVLITIQKSSSEVTRLEASGAVTIKSGIDLISSRKFTIDLSGASQLQAPGIISPEFDVDMTGASSLNISKVEATKGELDLSGANVVELAGKVEDLDIDGSGAVKVDLTRVEGQAIKLDLSGASSLKAGGFKEIRGELSGASSLQHQSQTKLNVSSSGSSEIESVLQKG